MEHSTRRFVQHATAFVTRDYINLPLTSPALVTRWSVFGYANSAGRTEQDCLAIADRAVAAIDSDQWRSAIVMDQLMTMRSAVSPAARPLVRRALALYGCKPAEEDAT